MIFLLFLPPQHFIEIEGSNNIQTVEREDVGMDFSQEEENVPTRDSVLCNTIASTEIDNRQPMENSDRETVQGASSQSISGNCETPLRTNVTVNRVRIVELMPIPKVIQNGLRQTNRTRTGRSGLLTDSEEIAQLETDYLKKKKKEMEKEKSKKTRVDKPRLSNKENISENGKVVATKRNENAVHEKNPLAVQNRQPRNARKPAFLTQNYFFD